MNTHLFQELINQGFLPYILVIITYVLISGTTQLLLKKNKKEVFKFGIFPFQKSISSNSYKPLDYSKFEGRIRSKNIVLESFHNNEEVFLKVTEVKSRKSKVYLHGNLTQDKRSGNYQLKMKFFLHRLLSPVFALVLMYFFAFRFVPFFDGKDSFIPMNESPFQFFAVFAILIMLFSVGQVIYLGRRDFKYTSELIDSMFNSEQHHTRKPLFTELNQKATFDKVSVEGRYSFERSIKYLNEFTASKFKEILSLSRINSLAFHEDNKGRILFKNDRPLDWQGVEKFNPNKPAYTNIAAITKGYIEKKSSTEVLVRMKFVKWIYFIYLVPLLIPLLGFIAFQEQFIFLMYIPLAIPTIVLTLVFKVRSKRYFKLLCQTFENK